MAKVGDRVQLLYTSDGYTNLEPGDEGEVVFVDDTGTVHVKWDRGSSLGLIPDIDRWAVIPTESA